MTIKGINPTDVTMEKISVLVIMRYGDSDNNEDVRPWILSNPISERLVFCPS